MIAAGHGLADIAGYSLAQVELFSAEAGAAERRRVKAQAIAVRVAAADKSGFSKFMRELS